MSFEGGKYNATLLGRVTVLKQVTRHASTLLPAPPRGHRGITLSLTLNFRANGSPPLARAAAQHAQITAQM